MADGRTTRDRRGTGARPRPTRKLNAVRSESMARRLPRGRPRLLGRRRPPLLLHLSTMPSAHAVSHHVLLTPREVDLTAMRLGAEARAQLYWTWSFFQTNVAAPVLDAATAGGALRRFRKAFDAATQARMAMLELLLSTPIEVAVATRDGIDAISKDSGAALDAKDALHFRNALDHFERASERFFRRALSEKLPPVTPANAPHVMRALHLATAVDCLIGIVSCGVARVTPVRSRRVLGALARECYLAAIAHHQAVQAVLGRPHDGNGKMVRGGGEIEDVDLHRWTSELQAPTLNA